MNKKATGSWIAAVCLIFIGCILFAGVMTMLKWDFSKLSTVSYETNEYEITESFRHISVVTNTADVSFESSESAKVVCFEQTNLKHRVTVRDDTLIIEIADTRKWYEHIGISFKTPTVTVSVPQSAYGTLSVASDTGDVTIPKDFSFESVDITGDTGNVTNAASSSGTIRIHTDTGRIEVKDVSAGALDLHVSTGKVTVSGVSCKGDIALGVSTGKTALTDVTCHNLSSHGDTGRITLKNVVASGTMSIERSTGDVTFDGADGAQIVVNTDTGHVTGTLLSEKMFIAETSTGKIRVPDNTAGGRCKISTSTGDILIDINP